MKMKKTKLIVSLLMILTMMMPAMSVQAAQTIYNNETGVHDGYNYELWKDSGNTSMTLNSGGTFSCQWSNINNALFRKGKSLTRLDPSANW